LATLEKYLPKLTVVEKPTGAQELVKTEQILAREPQTKKDTRQQSKIVCLWQEPCADKENQFCYFRGKWCNQQGRVKE